MTAGLLSGIIMSAACLLIIVKNKTDAAWPWVVAFLALVSGAIALLPVVNL